MRQVTGHPPDKCRSSSTRSNCICKFYDNSLKQNIIKKYRHCYCLMPLKKISFLQNFSTFHGGWDEKYLHSCLSSSWWSTENLSSRSISCQKIFLLSNNVMWIVNNFCCYEQICRFCLCFSYCWPQQRSPWMWVGLLINLRLSIFFLALDKWCIFFNNV